MDYKERREQQRKESGLSNYSDDENDLDIKELGETHSEDMNKVVKGEKKVMEDTRTSLNTNMNAT